MIFIAFKEINDIHKMCVGIESAHGGFLHGNNDVWYRFPTSPFNKD